MGLLLGICGYFIGSIPFSYLIPKWFGNVDIRRHGSGNTGTTNVVRTLGLKIGVLAFLGDFIKGMIPTLLGLLTMGEIGGIIGGSTAVLGHCYPVWLKFKGGKGIATSAGVLLILMPDMLLILLIGQIIIIALSRYMSLASITSAALFPVYCFVFSKSNALTIFSVFLGAFVIFKHRSNLMRLIRKQESKLKFSKNVKS